MSRTTIDYGIDLGTTNSSVALLLGTVPEVIPNEAGSSITPSAIWSDKRNQQYVGAKAKERIEDDPDNAAAEFKLRMGEKWKKAFARSGRQMSPEELSAEVLKSLKGDVRTVKGEDLRAAVITVPAAFELPQCEATRKAAELAGIAVCPLLQEPVAAASAYGFQSSANRVFWLVYDFGGGTFDAAIIQVRDGIIQVINHAGHNYLGGKNIDWDIVERKLIPRLAKDHAIHGFARGNPKWRAAIAKLKIKAEEAKIQVSRTLKPWEIWIENLCQDDRGEAVDFAYELTPSDIQEIIAPWVKQSIDLCRRALQEKGLSGKDIERTILVGGTSLFPWLQSQVQEELGTKLDFSIDPITVVARGAAVFAGSQRMPEPTLPVAAGTFGLELKYEPVGTDTAPMVGGKLKHPRNGSLEGFTIEFVETRTEWRSGRIRLPANGAFMTELHADKGRKCEYAIEVCEPNGTKVPCSPDRLSYTVGMVIGNAPLTHSVGVAMANNKMDVFFKKGDPLPARAMHAHAQAVYVPRGTKRGQRGDAIRIPFIEGENEDRADRNRLIGYLEIWADDPKFKRDVPAGSDVEITIEMDPSRLLKTHAYVPILDETFEAVIGLQTTPKSAAELQADFAQELSRLAALREQAEAANDGKAKDAIAGVEAGQVVEQAESLVIAATRGAEDAVAEGDRKLLDLKTAVDGAADALAWPNMVNEARSGLQTARQIVEQHGTSDEKARLRLLALELDRGINAHDPHTVRAKAEAIEDLRLRIVWRQPETWIGCLDYLGGQRTHMRDQKMAERLFAQARRAVEANDLEALKAAVRQLLGLLPPDEQAEANARGYGGTTMR